MSDLAPIQRAQRASKAAAAADRKDRHSEATKDTHGEAHGHWHGLAKSEKDDRYKRHYAAMAKHHFNRSYGKDSKSPYRIEARHRDVISGGIADKSKPGDFDAEQLRMGTEVEMEHTSSRRMAKEIAMDHLKEDPRYYTKLKKVHKESVMEIHQLLGLLEDVRYSFGEAAAPPPFKPKERRDAGMPSMPTRRGAQPPKTKLSPPRLPKDVRKAKSDKARAADAPAREKKVAAQLSVDKKRMASGGTKFGTKSLGIKRSFSSYKVPGAQAGPRDADVKAGVKMAGDAARTRASKGESFSNVFGSLIGECRHEILGR